MRKPKKIIGKKITTSFINESGKVVIVVNKK